MLGKKIIDSTGKAEKRQWTKQIRPEGMLKQISKQQSTLPSSSRIYQFDQQHMRPGQSHQPV